MEHAIWLGNLLDAINELGEEGRVTMDFIQGRGTKIGFKLVPPNVGAFWTIFGNIHLNSHYYNYNTSLNDIRIKTLIIHEVCHLKQGFFKALSVYGELEAWQLEFGVYHRIKGKYPRPSIAELMALPLEYDREVLKKAAKLMQDYAGKGYRIDLLPLYPFEREIKYWLTRT